MLDAGCGTGDNALCLAALGSGPLGIDVAETAVSIACAQAAERGLEAEFLVADALRLDRLCARRAGEGRVDLARPIGGR